jgi:hypothetical protein
MVFDFLAMFVIGVGAASLYMTLKLVLKDRLPRWGLPAVIGAAMLIFSVWNEYSWFSRSTAALPDEVEIILVPEDRSLWRPWTYAFPVTSRYMALDGTSLRVSPVNAAFRQADLIFVERWVGTQRVPIAFDCAGGRHADLVDGAVLADDGTLTGSDWITAAPDDIMQSAACNVQANGSSG